MESTEKSDCVESNLPDVEKASSKVAVCALESPASIFSGPSHEDFEYVYSACYLCNGYYGPCFDDPLCATCHIYLYPEDMVHCWLMRVMLSEKTDDEDSGNDEPADFLYNTIERRQSQQQQLPAAAHMDASPDLPSPPPRLLERLNMLSKAREPDSTSAGVVNRLPPEVLLVLFSYLDDVSLWSVGNVCTRWHKVVQEHFTSEQWRNNAQRRFPLFSPMCTVRDWFKIYCNLVASTPCKACLYQMVEQRNPPGDENSSWRRNRIRTELKHLQLDPPQGIRAVPLDIKCCHWQATITGPAGSPYEGGLFFLYIQVPYSYPMSPPIVRFLTRIFHPNVSRHGDIGIDCIQHNWSLALTLSKVLISVQSLLTDPYCKVCMEPEVGEMYVHDRQKFESIARSWTWRYAMHDVLIAK